MTMQKKKIIELNSSTKVYHFEIEWRLKPTQLIQTMASSVPANP
jgi:hypothetical protein